MAFAIKAIYHCMANRIELFTMKIIPEVRTGNELLRRGRRWKLIQDLHSQLNQCRPFQAHAPNAQECQKLWNRQTSRWKCPTKWLWLRLDKYCGWICWKMSTLQGYQIQRPMKRNTEWQPHTKPKNIDFVWIEIDFEENSQYHIWVEKLTLGSSNLSHLGLMKYMIPFHAPSKVSARINKIPIIT